MPNQISLQVGTNTTTLPLKGTTSQINAAILRFAIQRGIATEGRTPSEIGTDVLAEIVKHIRDGSVDRHRIELLAAQQAANEAEIALANDL